MIFLVAIKLLITFTDNAAFGANQQKNIVKTQDLEKDSIISAYHTEAKALMEKRKWGEAAIVFRSILKEAPGSIDATMGLARSLVLSGRREESLAVLHQANGFERGNSKKVVVRRIRVLSKLFLTSETFQTYQDGLNFLVARQYRNAISSFERALVHEPDNVEILTRIGQSQILDGDYDSAAERLKLAKRLNPFEPEIKLWLGRAMHQRGELNDGLAELKSARSELEESETAALWLADVFLSLGQKAAAIQILEEDVKKKPFHLLSLIGLARLRSRNNIKDSQELWMARKTLQLALSRLEKYSQQHQPKIIENNKLSLNLPQSVTDLKTEISKLMEQVENKLQRPETAFPQS
ncbi:MAG: tetratricopeptide repeat protein [Candidatus Poribacteria bacterium]